MCVCCVCIRVCVCVCRDKTLVFFGEEGIKTNTIVLLGGLPGGGVGKTGGRNFFPRHRGVLLIPFLKGFLRSNFNDPRSSSGWRALYTPGF